MSHQYEYSWISQYLKPTTFAELMDFGDENTQKSLALQFGKLSSKLPQIIDALPQSDGWEINSHSITPIGNTILVSILLQRHRNDKARHL
jgi:hypothetical protein